MSDLPTREQLEAWANTVDGALLPVFVRNVDGSELDCAVADDARALAFFLRSDALREALDRSEACVAENVTAELMRAGAWKRLADRAIAWVEPSGVRSELIREFAALLAQEKEDR